MALVFPGVMLMQMISAGAMGGGISSAIARALGAGRRDEADALVLHALVINIVLGAALHGGVLLFGRPLYRAHGRRGRLARGRAHLFERRVRRQRAAVADERLASVIRGTGNMLVPALVICAGVVLLVPLSPLLIFGFGPFPAMGIAGGGVALRALLLGGTAVLGWYVLSGRNLARLRLAPPALAAVRARSCASARSRRSARCRPTSRSRSTPRSSAARPGQRRSRALAPAARLEYLLVPLVFGLGAPLVALVGTNIGAGQRERALRIAWTGAAIAFVLTESIGWRRRSGRAPGSRCSAPIRR